MSEINYQEGHETAGQAKPVAWRYRYVKKGITDSQGEPCAYFHERRSLNNFHRDRVITFEQIAE